jgi:hypothetical protein
MPEATISTSTSPALGGSKVIVSTLHGAFGSQRMAARVSMAVLPVAKSLVRSDDGARYRPTTELRKLDRTVDIEPVPRGRLPG